MNRRRALAAVGAGVVGTSGCLRLRNEAEAQGEGETQDEADEAAGEEPARVTLSENWTADPSIDFVWTESGTFYFNGYNAATEAVHGSGVQWTNEVSGEKAEANLGADVFTTDGRHVVFGYIPDDNKDLGGHFHAYDTVTGEQLWSFGAPSDGKHNFAMGATMVDTTAIVAACHFGNERDQEPLVWGLDVETGEEVWRTGRETLPTSFIHHIGSYDGDVYVTMLSGGTQILDSGTGSLLDTRDSWSVLRSWGEACGQLRGDTFFAATRDEISAHPVGETGLEWSNADVGTASTAPAVDNSLVVVGTSSGGIHAFERASGEKRWESSIDGTVGSVETSGLRVWVADRETGLTAYDRDTGTTVHRSTQPINGSDIAVIDDVILFGGDGARAYSIEQV
jgi:outer membrane protein assembly factor BamB